MARSRVLTTLAVLFLVLNDSQLGASPFVLTFDELQHDEPIATFYDGGFGGKGSGPGPDYNVSFPSHALTLDILPSASGGVLYWTASSIPSIVINTPDGFDTGFSLLYTSDLPGSIRVYDGLDASGNLLAQMVLPDLNFASNYKMTPVGIAFSGTARSVVLGDDADFIAFDNLTFGRVQPIVPEPATVSLIVCGVALSFLSRRLRRPQG